MTNTQGSGAPPAQPDPRPLRERLDAVCASHNLTFDRDEDYADFLDGLVAATQAPGAHQALVDELCVAVERYTPKAGEMVVVTPPDVDRLIVLLGRAATALAGMGSRNTEDNEKYAQRLAERFVDNLGDSEPTGLSTVGMELLKGSEAESLFVVETEELIKHVAILIGNAFYDGEIVLAGDRATVVRDFAKWYAEECDRRGKEDPDMEPVEHAADRYLSWETP